MRLFVLPLFLCLTGCMGIARDGVPEDDEPDDDPNAPVVDLLTARKAFHTKVVPNPGFVADGPPDAPPAKLFHLVRYLSPAGPLAAYLSVDPKDGKKHPAVVWARGGFGGINGGAFWAKPGRDNDQTAAAFREKGIVLMVPSWRGENDNPGKFELFYGEVEDLLAALDFVKHLPYVDPNRVYLAGHSTGGTLTLLAATATDKFRAAFSFGGAPDLARVLSDGHGYGNTPFEPADKREAYYRSATNFVRAIKSPTFYFEGCKDGYERGYCPDADRMMARARRAGVPFEAYALPWGDHFTILHKTTRLVAAKIVADDGPACNIAFTKDELKSR